LTIRVRIIRTQIRHASLAFIKRSLKGLGFSSTTNNPRKNQDTPMTSKDKDGDEKMSPKLAGRKGEETRRREKGKGRERDRSHSGGRHRERERRRSRSQDGEQQHCLPSPKEEADLTKWVWNTRIELLTHPTGCKCCLDYAQHVAMDMLQQDPHLAKAINRRDNVLRRARDTASWWKDEAHDL
jgi:hypothetical protein